MSDKPFTYPSADRRRCYWLVRDCLKERGPCSTKCPDFISVARADRIKKERMNHIIERAIRRESNKLIIETVK